MLDESKVDERAEHEGFALLSVSHQMGVGISDPVQENAGSMG